MTERAQVAAGLLGLVALSILPAIAAGFHAPPGNDLLLHGHLVAGFAEALREHGWTAFQDPWFDGIGAGFPIAHHYPHLPHQLAALLTLLGMSHWTALSIVAVAAVLAVGPATYLGARWLALSPPLALLAATVAVTIGCADPFGHALTNYGFNGHGLFSQLVGMVFAALAVPATWRATRERSLARIALAAVLLSLVVRSSLPAAWVSGLVLAALILGEGRRDLGPRLGRAAAVGAGALLLSLGFLVPFFADLGASGVYEIVDPTHVRGEGLLRVLQRLFGGDYLDGGLRGLWTGVTLVAMGVAITRADARSRGLALGALLSVLLLCGRATWGDWIDDLPLVGSFHDRRYLLGLHLAAPLLVASVAGQLLTDHPSWGPRLRAASIGVAGLAAVMSTVEAGRQVADHGRFAPNWQTFRLELGPAVSLATRADLRLELAAPDGPVAGASVIDSLRHAGVATAGKPLHHYALIRQGHLWWRFWLAGPASTRDRVVTDDDLFAFGAHALLVPRTHLPAAPRLPEWERSKAGPFDLLRPPSRPDRHRSVGLVRSDLLVHANSPALQGLAVAWHSSGAHTVGQFPTVAIAGVGAPPPSGYARTTHLDRQDPSALLGLPTAAGLGRIVEADDWTARLDGVTDGAWLVFGAAWHPRLRATVDGADKPVHLLLPGRAGVQLPAGATNVSLIWEVPAWRGAWAALNVLLVLGLLGLALARRED